MLIFQVIQNCSSNTGGAHCESCAEGYYRSDYDGSCKLCPCPSETNNHAYTCYFPKTVNFSAEHTTCYCKIGYTGRYCDRLGNFIQFFLALFVVYLCSITYIRSVCTSDVIMDGTATLDLKMDTANLAGVIHKAV